MQYINFFIAVLNNYQFQLSSLDDISNQTVAPLDVENVAYHESKSVHRMKITKSNQYCKQISKRR